MWKIWMPRTSYKRYLFYVNMMVIYMMMWFCCYGDKSTDFFGSARDLVRFSLNIFLGALWLLSMMPSLCLENPYYCSVNRNNMNSFAAIGYRTDRFMTDGIINSFSLRLIKIQPTDTQLYTQIFIEFTSNF